MGTGKGFLLLVATALVAAAALLFSPPFAASTATRSAIDLTAEVSAAQCAPCHLSLSQAPKPGLIFDHGMHLVIACSACHSSMPHQNGKTYTPPMELCFNCHGIQHGPQGELARRDCSACHTPSFDLTPSSHTKDFAGKAHATQAKADGVNDCMMCHNGPKDCDACHSRQAVLVGGKPIGPMPKAYVPVAAPKPSKPPVMIYPDKPTTMEQCVYCHPDLDAFDKGKVIFQHSEHLKRDYKCTVCHPTFPHSSDTIQRPSMQVCYQCHGLVHSTGGLVATDKCDKCHPKGFDLKPPDHTVTFEAGAHKKKAGEDVSYCTMCHATTFCIDCHQGRKELPDGTYSPRIVPGDHKKATWRTKHGQLFLQQQGVCAACHDSSSCTVCHYTLMPHPADWQTQHGPVAKGIPEKSRDCNVCHTDRETCQQCHHDAVRRAELKPENCVGCHPEMKQQPYTSIKNKALAEHAVHFVVKKAKGEYYVCDDCHIGFGADPTHQQAQLQQGHDLRLCYSCHGALDYENHIIAPYPGAQLCLRCHQNLNI